MELLAAFGEFAYPNAIGPGVYDIHSPNLPTQAHMETLLRKALETIPPERLWVNPDCGLKTRGWPETIAALQTMVAAAKNCGLNMYPLLDLNPPAKYDLFSFAAFINPALKAVGLIILAVFVTVSLRYYQGASNEYTSFQTRREYILSRLVKIFFFLTV